MAEDNMFKKFWNFLWHDDSLSSWIISLILIIILVKFIFFPLISLILGTSLPLVIVESCSMNHQGNLGTKIISPQDNFDDWWSRAGKWYIDKGILKEEADNWRFKSGLDMGDIIIVTGADISDIKIGDIIIFQAGKQHPIIHRVVETQSKEIATKGDNYITNPSQLPGGVEQGIEENQLLGKAALRIPKIGWMKLIFFKSRSEWKC